MGFHSGGDREYSGKLTVSTAAKDLPAVRLYQKHGYQLTAQTTLPDGLELVRFYKQATRTGRQPYPT